MKRILASGLAIAAFASGEAAAQSGYVDFSYSNVDGDVSGFDLDEDVTAVSGAAAFGLRGRLEFQLDGQVAKYDEAQDTVIGGTIHVLTRNDGWMFGAFAGGVSGDETDYFSGGLEGSLYFQRISVSGALAYVKSEDIDTDGVILQQEVRYFFSRNTRVQAGIDYGNLETYGYDWDALAFNVGAEHRIEGSPLSIFGGVSHLEVNDLIDVSGNVYTLGLRYNFDQDLAFRDEAGASLLSVPRFGQLF